MITARLEYYGDKEKAATLKGKAMSFYEFVLNSMGDVDSITREKRIDMNTSIQVVIATNGFGQKYGVVKIYVNPKGNNEDIVGLLCTSFNDDDLGTQVYKAPYPPITKGGLYDIGDNPNGLILPSPTYSARTNYWVDDKEKNTVSWDYVDSIEAGITRKYGKIAIQGLENQASFSWRYFEPLAVGLLSDTQLVAVCRFNDYYESANIRYVNVYDYTLDFVNNVLNLTLYSSFNLTESGIASSNTDHIIGMLDDGCKTVIYEGDSASHPGQLSLKYFILNSDHSAVSSSGIIEEKLLTITLGIGEPDIRGNSVGYSVAEYTGRSIDNTRTETFTEPGGGSITATLSEYVDNYSYKSYVWSNLSKTLIREGIGHIHLNETGYFYVPYSPTSGIWSLESTYNVVSESTAYVLPKLKKCIYNSGESTLTTNANGSQQTITNNFYINDQLLSNKNSHFLDYSYTDKFFIAHRHYYIDDAAITTANDTLIYNFKKNAFKFLPIEKLNLSVTKLPG
jgi:hypothetical protein